MKNYIKQYKDFLNESTLKTTWITPDELLNHLDIKHLVRTSNDSLSDWFKKLKYHHLCLVMDFIFSKHKRIHTCLRVIKEIKVTDSETLYDQIKSLEDPRPMIAINACERYLKGEIEDEELETIKSNARDASYDISTPIADAAEATVFANISYLIDSILQAKISSSNAIICEEILLEELEKFDCSKLEKEIRGYNIFGE